MGPICQIHVLTDCFLLVNSNPQKEFIRVSNYLSFSSVKLFFLYRHTLPYHTLQKIVFSINWRFRATLHQTSLLAHFSNGICSLFVTLCHILVSSWNISKFFITVFVKMICDLTTLIVLGGGHKPYPSRTVNSVGKCCVSSNCSTNRPFSVPPCAWVSLFSETR